MSWFLQGAGLQLWDQGEPARLRPGSMLGVEKPWGEGPGRGEPALNNDQSGSSRGHRQKPTGAFAMSLASV